MSSNYFIYSSFTTAQAYENNAWSNYSSQVHETNVLGIAATTQITQAWAVPYQRLTDNNWIIAVCPFAVAVATGFIGTQSYSSSWFPQLSSTSTSVVPNAS